jgi:hypothetical protein
VLGVISMAGQTSESLSSGMPIWLPFSI